MSDLDELPRQLTELRDLIRQAHEATRDLRGVIREATALRDRLPQKVTEIVEHTIGAQIDQGLNSFKEAQMRAIEDAQAAVFARFDTMTETLLGIDPRSKRQGKLSIPDMIAIAQQRSGMLPEAASADGRPLPPGLTGRRTRNGG
jgi:hypothetical protein